MTNTNTTHIIQKNIDEARAIKKGTAGFINVFMNEIFRPDRNVIEVDKMLTYEGKKAKLKKLRNQCEVGFMREMQKRRDKYESLLQEAKLEAEKVLLTAAPKVEEHTQKLFDLQMDKVKGAVAFAPNSTEAIKALAKLVDVTKEPALAKQAQGAFMQLSQQALELMSGEGKVDVRRQLGDMYKRLEKQSEVGDATGARQAIEAVESLAGAPFAIGYVQEAMLEISKSTADYMNEPNRYFEEKASFVQEVEAGRV